MMWCMCSLFFFNHFYKGGLDLHHICDWCRLLWTFRETLDVKRIESLIEQMGLLSEWKAFGTFAVDYLGMPVEAMPMFDNTARWKKKAERIKNIVLTVGNMGYNRDMSYYSRYPYLIGNIISFTRRVGDLIRHSRNFLLNSLTFFPGIMLNGLKSAARGE